MFQPSDELGPHPHPKGLSQRDPENTGICVVRSLSHVACVLPLFLSFFLYLPLSLSLQNLATKKAPPQRHSDLSLSQSMCIILYM